MKFRFWIDWAHAWALPLLAGFGISHLAGPTAGVVVGAAVFADGVLFSSYEAKQFLPWAYWKLAAWRLTVMVAPWAFKLCCHRRLVCSIFKNDCGCR